VTSRAPAPDARAPARTLKATFTRPFIAHASLAPSCALARWDGERVHVWSHTQGIFNLRADLAIALALPPEAIVVEHREGAGCYGHNGADDVALDAALLARAVPGRPVRVSWSREDELAWAPFGPAMAVDVAVDLDARARFSRGAPTCGATGTACGRAARPRRRCWRPRTAPMPPPPSWPSTCRSPPAGARTATPPCLRIPALEVTNHRVLSMPLRTSALRSLGAFANVFAIESMVDDIARARGEDPVAWRLRHIADPRRRAVIEAVAARAPWAAGSRARASAAASASRATRATAPIAPWRWKWSSRTRCA
jgi:CO/xanthine dehydrogenase Mo-binding subunit